MSLKKRPFLRADTFRHLRLGKKRRKLQKWRRPRGHHNKLRLKRFSHPVQPGVGFGSPKSEAGKIKGLLPVRVHNLAEIEKLSPKRHIAILARVGARKKLTLLKRAQELQIKISNVGKEMKK